jgi:hypothetical protein
MAQLPELGRLGHKQLAKLAGVATQLRQRTSLGRATHLGRAGAGTLGALHGGAGGVPLEPGH